MEERDIQVGAECAAYICCSALAHSIYFSTTTLEQQVIETEFGQRYSLSLLPTEYTRHLKSQAQ